MVKYVIYTSLEMKFSYAESRPIVKEQIRYSFLLRFVNTDGSQIKRYDVLNHIDRIDKKRQ